MTQHERAQSRRDIPIIPRRDILIILLVLVVAGGLGCLPRAEQAPRVSITGEALDRIDAAMEELAAGRWPSWSMQVTGTRLAFEVDVADTEPADACSGIGAAVRLIGEDIDWSADLTRNGRPLTSCGSFGQLARGEPAGPPGTRS